MRNRRRGRAPVLTPSRTADELNLPMKTSSRRPGLLRLVSPALWSLAAGALLFATGCVTVVPVTSNPAGATVTVNGRPVGATPTQLQAEDNKPVEVYFSLNGYFPETLTYTPQGGTPAPISAQLEPSRLAKSYEITTQPAGANVALDGKPVGTTPVTVPVVFVRPTKNAAWVPQKLTLTKVHYQSESVTLTSALSSVPAVAMSLLKDERTYSITAVNLDGAPVPAVITVDGAEAGRLDGTGAPFALKKTYERADKKLPWPKFSLSVELPGQYKPIVSDLTYERDTTIALKLDAVTEITARIFSPDVVMTPVGATLKFVERATVATLRTGDDSTSITELKQVTKYGRQDDPNNRLQTISSFTVTPDGQNVVFALSDTDESGNRYSNLFIKRADDVSGGVSRLTQGSRYYDAQPFIANDGSNYLVFTSNRGDRSKPDVFRVTLVENRLSGGISRLTNDTRLNYMPTYSDSNRQLFYLSIEPAFPKAEPYLSSIRFDGSLPTQLPIVGEQINNTHPEKVFFVRVDSDTKKQQIYSITADGKLETALINQEDFKRANCFQPCVSADGQRVLFVSDHTGDAKDRPNNDLYMINVDGTNLQRLTYNESDDTLPVWSPTEEGVIYFLSTRGGAPNIWRFKLVTGR